MSIDFIHEEAIALPGSFSQYDMKVIYPALKEMKVDDVYLEVGVQYGRSLDFARRHSVGQIYGIDPLANPPLPVPEVPGTEFIQKYSNDAVKDWTRQIAVLFIDGDHTYEGCADDFNNFAPFVELGGIIFFHDCDDTSPGVERVFETLSPVLWEKIIHKTPELRTSVASARRIA